MVTERQPGAGSEPTLSDLSESLITVYGTDFGVHTPTWISRFTDMTRQAAAYRAKSFRERTRIRAQLASISLPRPLNVQPASACWAADMK